MDAAPSNLAQLTNWDGAGGDFWAANADRFDEGVAAYHPAFLAAAAVDPTSRVLDVGCGAGQVSCDVAGVAAGGAVLGVDLSAALIELARRRAARARLTTVSFVQADAQVHPFAEHGFDLAISRHGAMFFGDPVAAFTNIGRALRPGGRLTLLTWQPFARQEWLRSFLTALAGGGPVVGPPADAPSPLALSEPDRVEALLAASGFVDVALEGLYEPMWFGADVEDALGFVAGLQSGMLERLAGDARARALDDLRTSLAAHLGEGGVTYESAAWLVRARSSPSST